MHVVATKGLRGLTYRAVAEEAGVAHTLVAHHFGTRNALLTETLAFAIERTLPTVTTAPGSGDLDALFASLAEITDQNPDDQALFFALSLEARNNHDLLPLIEDLYATFQRAVSTELEAIGIAPDDALTHLVVAATDGLLFQQLCLGHTERTRTSLSTLRTVLSTYRSNTTS